DRPASLAPAACEPAHEPRERVVTAVDEPLLERDDRIVGDRDPLGTHLAAAFGDVAQADARLVGEHLRAVESVQRVHLERRHPHHEPGPEVAALEIVLAQHVADVLAEEALDALAELGDAVDVLLAHQPVRVLPRRERRDPLVDLVVPGDVRDEVPDHGKRPHRLDPDRVVLGELVETRLAHQARSSVHLGAARAALGGLAVPADGEILRLRALDLAHRVEDDHPLLGRDLVVDEAAAGGVTAPDLEGARAQTSSRAFRSSTSGSSSATLTTGRGSTRMPSCSLVTTTLCSPQ